MEVLSILLNCQVNGDISEKTVVTNSSSRLGLLEIGSQAFRAPLLYRGDAFELRRTISNPFHNRPNLIEKFDTNIWTPRSLGTLGPDLSCHECSKKIPIAEIAAELSASVALRCRENRGEILHRESDPNWKWESLRWWHTSWLIVATYPLWLWNILSDCYHTFHDWLRYFPVSLISSYATLNDITPELITLYNLINIPLHNNIQIRNWWHIRGR